MEKLEPEPTPLNFPIAESLLFIFKKIVFVLVNRLRSGHCNLRPGSGHSIAAKLCHQS